MHFTNFIIAFFRSFNRALQAKVGNYFFLHVILLQSIRLQMSPIVKDALAQVSYQHFKSHVKTHFLKWSFLYWL